MEILVVSPEAGNWRTLSPLATAVNRMTYAFARAGANALTCSPFYKPLLQDLEGYSCVFSGTEKLHGKPYEIWKSPGDPFHTYIYNEEYFGRPDIYGPPGDLPYGDNHLRFAFLASAALDYAQETGFKCQAILGHEWGGALAGALIHTVYQEAFGQVPFFFTVHNITYDFHVSSSEIENIGLPRKDFNMDGYEFWGKVSLLKAGICYAHKVLFPSPGYRDAMINTNLPGGLSGFLIHNQDKLIGVQFGVSYQVWDFNSKDKLPIKQAKKKARAKLEGILGCEVGNKPILYAHLDPEAGNTSETLATILSDIAKQDIFIVVGIAPDDPEWDYYQDVSKQYPGIMAIRPIETKSASALRDVLAGSDILFAANLKEPSTSIILKALATGTLPLTGRNVGVATMLDDYAPETSGCANAFLVDDANAPHQMLRRLKDALHVYHEESADWDKAVINAYSGFHYEWDRTIGKYLLILGELGL